MFDLHRHDEYSTFDGFGKADELAKIAKRLGYSALGLSNHGNTNGLVKHYFACKEQGIKPILGVEAYFQPKFTKGRERFHLCLFAKNSEGYKNMNKMLFSAEHQKYYNPVVTFDDLRKYHEGVICTSACIAGFVPMALRNDKYSSAEKSAKKFINIFGDDFYIEIQPYKIDDVGTQEKTNVRLMALAEKLGIKCILTSDSHYGEKSEFETYLKMHEIAGHTGYDFRETYAERYMPSEDEIVKRFLKMHHKTKYHVEDAKREASIMLKNLDEIVDKVDGDILESFESKLPKFGAEDSFKTLVSDTKRGLKKRGKGNRQYIDRCKEELDVIKHHGYQDYFLMVADYVNWAKSKGIAVGPGRGSGCNSLVNYALGITDVDSIKFGLDFRRFLRKDKAKMPDIDLDFETDRRKEVIEYLLDKYKGHAAQICSYGLYRVDNLINDLVKVCGLETTGNIDAGVKKRNEAIRDEIKAHIRQYVYETELDAEGLLGDRRSREYDRKYDNIISHFAKLYKKMRFIGTHAAGVAITGGDIFQYTALRIDKEGKIYTAYDLVDLETINVVKFDILGLKTMSSIGELRRLTGHNGLNEDWIDDVKILEAFGKGDTDGIFQFEKETAKDILRNIECNCFDDIVAASSMNRPGPLSLGMPKMYAENKQNIEQVKDSKYWEYTKNTYGTIVYQEQIQNICVDIGGLSWGDADKVLKMQKGSSRKQAELFHANYDNFKKIFMPNAKKNGLTKAESTELYDNLFNYSFNAGHGTGYALISVDEMFYKVYYPVEYWYVKCKYAEKDNDRFKFMMNAVKNNIVLFLPHVNYTADFSLRMFDGERILQQGLSSIKGIGLKTALLIQDERNANGPYISKGNFMERLGKVRGVNKRVIELLEEQGALEFNKKRYLSRVVKYNSSLLGRC